ncbi:UDP-N-acetylglucosamine--N-acetylmuramyl-(pentapeptide) pyrophosphoryl-undecaprenol N-acetylglucosamine transferase [Flagellimonas onchidii]|uniref:UDP-N-acetylglucosamine--N-acetylmuramyl- (pentapeptide) pyrophosphoryl-undecaprenol N-acetylglucosamine transferase n=1 Tax=Flagellimonas onchidii TaxID=2562684 RepID=UPI0010A64D5F|nr:UDP-N-acetylglucosamine--N-acetylmuramyl-(pentapeptide) pyrophosphoryl-undecaprenol N-acetylglucosamine transferase [Allomuricauda onchidii]
MQSSKRILVAPLNWGLGHATRCIPIIKALLNHGHQPFLASDGVALSLLQKEFPNLPSFELPSYKITYAEKGRNFKIKMIWDSPKVLKAVTKEKKAVKKLVKEHQIDGIISDNRLGVYYKKVPCVFITHQLNVLSGNTTWMSSKAHQKIIKKFDACWVPDVEHKPNLTGKLGHLKKPNMNIKYLGPLSRFEKEETDIDYDLMVLLSGPEPQRTFLEEKLLFELKGIKGNILFVKGKIEDTQIKEQIENGNSTVDIYNFMQSEELQNAINRSAKILCRSGYTTVMDLAKLEKKAFFIPTPGQYEQEYLAKRLQKQVLVPFSSQDEFKLQDLGRIEDFEGLTQFESSMNYTELFGVFSIVKENSEPIPSSLST